MTSTDLTLIWLRQDLRLADNPALLAAGNAPVIPVYILEPEGEDPHYPGAAARWWLEGSLRAVATALEARGSRLILRRGKPGDMLDALIAETGATRVLWNRCYDPVSIARDSAIKAALSARGIAAQSFNGSLLHEPWELKPATGGHFRVFTPFSKAALKRGEPFKPAPAPTHLSAPAEWPGSEDLADWGLTPTRPDWAGGFRARWIPGEAEASRRLEQFLKDGIGAYADRRDRPDIAGATSCLSPYLHAGNLSPRQVWHELRRASAGKADSQGADKFASELLWREFCYHQLYHNPGLREAPLDARYRHFPWREDAAALTRWQRGQTGIPIVDAGMRELWVTGFMHNRVRMIAASFLVKHLLQPWQTGRAWFEDTLVDADLASNSASWQWVAGCGADAAPYFRIFNPVLQGEKFDPDGAYVRRWVPELAALPAAWIHKPWLAPPAVAPARAAYPAPLVDLASGRQRALDAFASLKQQQN
ncbi:cryptochrome/photolyase family protein [Radicibacter daui]|uniref:cryptochrome/photolyase family protein n=1 Tax=Radicibacter daui TaxID=3064829 RepID=UPI004046A133